MFAQESTQRGSTRPLVRTPRSTRSGGGISNMITQVLMMRMVARMEREDSERKERQQAQQIQQMNMAMMMTMIIAANPAAAGSFCKNLTNLSQPSV